MFSFLCILLQLFYKVSSSHYQQFIKVHQNCYITRLMKLGDLLIKLCSGKQGLASVELAVPRFCL